MQERGRFRYPVDVAGLVTRVIDLPVLPETVTAVLKVVNNSNISAQEMEQFILRDQVLATRVLRVANSAFYGFGRRIETVRQAVVLLGTRKLREVVSAASTQELFRIDSSQKVVGRCLWRHALAVALWTQQILEVLQRTPDMSVFTAGLLHDIGIVVLHQRYGTPYGKVLQYSDEKDIHHFYAEKELMGTTHAEIGGKLCSKWSLPVEIAHLVQHHHSNQLANEPLLQILRLADLMAVRSGCAAFAWGVEPELPTEIYDYMGLTADGMVALMRRAANVNEELAAFSGESFSREFKAELPVDLVEENAPVENIEVTNRKVCEEKKRPAVKHRIMLIENTDADGVAAMLEDWGYLVDPVSGFPEVQQILRSSNPALVMFIDQSDEAGRGVDLCRQVRQERTVTAEPYIIVTVEGDGAEKQLYECIKAGANDVLIKPYSEYELRARLLLGQRGLALQCELAARIRHLQEAMDHVKTLQGLIPICSYCHRIRTDQAAWERIETYVEAHSDALFSHGICPECMQANFEGIDS